MMSENKLRRIDSSSSQTDRSAFFVGQSYDLKWIISAFLNGSSPNRKCHP